MQPTSYWNSKQVTRQVYFLFKKSYWHIVALQCCIRARCTVIWSLTHIYCFFFRLFPHIGYHRMLSTVPCAMHRSSCRSSMLYICVSHAAMFDCLDPMDCSPPGSSVHGILQARILEWVAISFPSVIYQFSLIAQSCLTLHDPMDCSTPGFPVHHQLQEPTQTHVH